VEDIIIKVDTTLTACTTIAIIDSHMGFFINSSGMKPSLAFYNILLSTY